MPPKKKDAKKGGNAEEIPVGEDPKVLLSNYVKFCKLIGIEPSQQVKKTLEDEESETNWPVTQIIIDNDLGPLPTGNARALATAILGVGPAMVGGPYKLLNTLRIWKCTLGNDATAAIAELLRLGGAEVKLQYLELFNDAIGPQGASALGRALSLGNNRSLQTLKLDYNDSIGQEGATLLARGLRTNSTLKQLHLPYCAITEEAGGALGEMVMYSKCGLTTLNLMGNQLGGAGLSAMCTGLARNKSLTYLCLADNLINHEPADLDALRVFASSMVACETLAHIDLLYNRIGEAGAAILVPVLTPDNTRIKTFLVDATLPTTLFEALHRKDAGGKKGKGGKGKKKK